MTKTAKTYGGALYDLAKEEALCEEFLNQLQLIAAVFEENPEYRKLALYLIANGVIQFVASGNSPMDLPEAMRALKRSLPLERYKRIKGNSRMLLSGAEPSTFLAD